MRCSGFLRSVALFIAAAAYCCSLGGCVFKQIRTMDMGELEWSFADAAANGRATPPTSPAASHRLAVVSILQSPSQGSGGRAPFGFEARPIGEGDRRLICERVGGTTPEDIRFASPDDAESPKCTPASLLRFADREHADRLLLWSIDSDFNTYSLFDMLAGVLTNGFWPVDSSCEGRTDAILIETSTGKRLSRWTFGDSTWRIGQVSRNSAEGMELLTRTNVRMGKRLAQEVGDFVPLADEKTRSGIKAAQLRRNGWGEE